MATRSIAWLRALLLLSLIGFSAVVLRTLLDQGEDVGGEAEPGTERNLETRERGLVLAGEGFDYEYTEGGRQALSIHGDRMLSDRDDNVVLEGVELTLYQEDGDAFHLVSEKGSYNLRSEQSELEGDVVVRGPDGLRFETERITVHRGQLIQSKSPVRFRFAERYAGRANSLTVTLRRRVYRLDGKVRIDLVRGVPAVGFLACDLLLFERDEGLIRALGDVRLRRGDDFLSARRLAVRLTEDERRASFIRAHWGVTGRRAGVDPDGDPFWIGLRGEALSLTLDETTGDPQELEIESSDRSSVILEQETAAGSMRRLSTPYLTGEFAAGELRLMKMSEPVALTEALTSDPQALLGWGCAKEAQVELDSGGFVRTILEGAVELWQSGLHSRGDQATVEHESGAGELQGVPAAVLFDRGELTAPAIHQREDGSIEAEGGVLARFVGGTGSFRGRDEPVRVESESASWSPADGSVVFLGNVQAWQGTSLLLAQEVREETAVERLTASGGVRTLWEREAAEVPERFVEVRADPGIADSGGPESEAAPEAPREEALEVTAESLVYDRPSSVITYQGDVYARQGLRSMRCEQMEADLDDDGKARRVTCRENASVVDRLAGRTVEGDLAVYDLETSTARVSGERVRMEDADGREVVGPVLVYDFATGSARVESPGVFEPIGEGEEQP